MRRRDARASASEIDRVGMGDSALEAWLKQVFDESFATREEDVTKLLKNLVAEGMYRPPHATMRDD